MTDTSKPLQRAINAHQKGNLNEALLLYQQLLADAPDTAQAQHNLGMIFFALEQYKNAFAPLKAAYDLDANDPDYMRGYGYALYSIGDLKNAETLFRASLAKQHGHKDTLEYLVKILNSTGRPDDVVALLAPYAEGAKVMPEVLYPYCTALISLHQEDKALEVMKRETDKHKNNIQYIRLLGALYIQLSRFDEAVEVMRKTTKMQPEEIGNWSNLCAACKGAYLFDEGIKAAETALKINPEHFDSLANLGVLYREKGEPEKGLVYLQKALELRPAWANTHYNMGLNMVAGGYLREGWPESEWRWQIAANNSPPRPHHRPLWDGSDIGEKTLCLFTDQGVGDTIQFCRLFHDVIKRCPKAKIILRCEPKLVPLLSLHFGDRIECLPLRAGDTIDSEEYDVQCPVATLLSVLNADTDSIDPRPYLKAPAPINYRDNPDQKVIGISWYTKSLGTGYKRSLALTEFLFLKDLPNVKVIDLQYGDTLPARTEAAEQGLNIFHDDTVDAWADLLPFVNQVAGCDLVISIDNTTVHTAGALGVPVWTITPYVSYWRWSLHKEKTPWYDSMRFFQQTQPGKYDDVLGRIKDACMQWLGGDVSVLRPGKYEPAVPPYKERKKQKQALLINADDPLAPWEDRVGALGLRSVLEQSGYDVKPCLLREIEDTHIPPPSLTDFDSPLYATQWKYKNPSFMAAIDRADEVIVNGGQHIHGTGPLALKLLYVAYYAKHFAGKKLRILNHNCFPENGADLTDAAVVAYYRKVYLRADEVAVTDPLSLHLLQQLEIDARLAQDAVSTLPLPQAAASNNKVAVILQDLPLAKTIELLQQIGGMLGPQNLVLCLPINKRDAFGLSQAQQIVKKLGKAACQIAVAETAQDWLQILGESAAILTNHPVAFSCATLLSKKLLTLPAELPSIQALCHLYGSTLSDVENFMDISNLSTEAASNQSLLGEVMANV